MCLVARAPTVLLDVDWTCGAAACQLTVSNMTDSVDVDPKQSTTLYRTTARQGLACGDKLD
jgi:hypothetical protein